VSEVCCISSHIDLNEYIHFCLWDIQLDVFVNVDFVYVFTTNLYSSKEYNWICVPNSPSPSCPPCPNGTGKETKRNISCIFVIQTGS
jgi:hypothetical protein